MRIAALITGLIGGTLGFLSGLVVLPFGGVGLALGGAGAGETAGLGFAAMGLALFGCVGAALALAKPRLSSVMLLVAGVGSIIAISYFAIVAAPLLLVAALLAFMGRNQPRPRTA